MSEPLISVVMSVCNGAAFLGRAIESVLAQTCADFEFIIIDDGSWDASWAVIRQYALQDRRITPFSQDNQGLALSLNRGLAKARGKYFARMDSDDICAPERFALQAKALQARPDLGVLGCDVQLIDQAGHPAGKQIYPKGAVLRDRLLHGSLICHPAAMARTGLLRALGGYRDYYEHCEDYDLWLRLAEKAELDNLPETLLSYRVHPASVTSRGRIAQVLGTLVAQGVRLIARRTGRDLTDDLPPVSEEVLEALPLLDAEREGLYLRLLPMYFLACRQSGRDPRQDPFAMRCLGWLLPRLDDSHGEAMCVFKQALEANQP